MDTLDFAATCRTRVLALALCIHLSGCEPAPSEVRLAGPILRDSAGVLIITSLTPAWGEEDAWRVEPVPAVTLGGSSSPDGHLIWHVRGATRLSDGRIAALVGGATAPQVLIFDRDGRRVRSIGRAGRGPGEFMEPMHLQYHVGDTITVWERFFGRITSFDTTGVVVGLRHIDYARVADALRFRGESDILLPLADGSFIAQVSGPDLLPGEVPVASWFRQPVVYVRMRQDYTADTLGWYEGLTLGYVSQTDRLPVIPLAGANSSAAASPAGQALSIFVSNGDSTGIHVFDESGVLTRVLRLGIPPTPISPEEQDAMLRRSTMTAEGRARLEERLRKFPPAAHHPLLRFMVVDHLGYLWGIDRMDATRATVWHVFDPAGHWLGRVRVPLTRVYDIGSDYILGVKRDEMSVESIHEFRLVRG
jgi:hypothetical protein